MNYLKNRPLLVILLLALLSYIFWTYFRPIEGNKLVDKSSIQYVNSLYQTDSLMYETLNNNEKKMYMIMLKDGKNAARKRDINYKDYNCSGYSDCSSIVNAATIAIGVDHPELLSDGSMSWSEIDDSKMQMRYKRAINTKLGVVLNELKILRIVDNIKKKTKDMTEYEKIKYVYDYIGESYYSISSEALSLSSNQSAYLVFIKKTGVCAAFAKASQIIFQNIGIESYLVQGTTTGPHMWNIIKLSDGYYYFDSTYSAYAPKGAAHYYNGLGISSDGYTLDNSELYPKIDGTKYLSGR